MKLMERFVRFGLVAMIALSFFLTYLIWLSPTNRDLDTEKEMNSELQNEQNAKDSSEIFLPLRLTRISNENIQETNTESFIKRVQTLLSDADYQEAELIKYSTKEEYATAATLMNGIEMTYAAALPLEVYLTTFDVGLPTTNAIRRDRAFLQIQIDLETEKIRFLNRIEQTIIEADITSEVNDFQEIFRDDTAAWVDVFRDSELKFYQYYTYETVKLPMFSYISAFRPYTVFRDSFFTNPKNIRSNDASANLNIYDGSESMNIRQNQQLVTYRGTTKIENTVDMYDQSYRYIRGLGTNYGSLRLFDQSQSMMDYRIFVEGFPIFSNQDEGRIQLNFSNNALGNQRIVEIRAALNTIQVPIPSENERELPSSHSVVSNLIAYGADKELIEMIIVGYNWRNLEDSGVVDLEPNWYVKYEGIWVQYHQLLNQLQESEGPLNGL